MIHIRQISRSFGVLAIAVFSALLSPVNCLGQGYTITTIAGQGPIGGCSTLGDGGPARNACLASPSAVAVDAAGNLFIADTDEGVIRKISPAGMISTVAGNVSLAGGYSGDGSSALHAGLYYPQGVAVDAAGNLYIADTANDRIRKVATDGTIMTVAGGGNAYIPPYGDGGPAINASLDGPQGVALDASGNLYIADRGHACVRKVAPNGTIATVAGGASLVNALISGKIGDGGPATSAALAPGAVAVDASGALYIADDFFNRIRKVSPNGIISTIAGSGTTSYSGDGGPGPSAGIDLPYGVAVDVSGNVYIADTGDARVRMVSTDGTITTIAGNGSIGSTGDGVPATSAQLYLPYGIAVSSSGRLYIADTGNNLIRMLTPAASTSPPTVKSGGVISAGAFGAFTSIAPGSWIEIYGSNLASDSRLWTGTDFTGVTHPHRSTAPR